MAEESGGVSGQPPRLEFADERMAEFLRVLELMAAGDTRQRITISDRHDELDALAHGVNVLVSELGWATAREIEAKEERAASAERANADKNIFLRNLSHEIRTPLAALLGFADLLTSDSLTPQDRSDLLRRLQANGRAVLALLDDVLDLARLDAKRIVVTPEPVVVVELLKEVMASVKIGSPAKALDMRIEAAVDALGTLRTDHFRLRQILVNLVSNAVKFTEAGSVVASVRASSDEHGERWTIDITDTGIGIAADRHPYLFEPFEQANDSITRVYGGNGLGLALSRRLAEQLGGTLVLFYSAPGDGTTLRLTLKPLPAEAAPQGDTSSTDALDGRELDGRESVIDGAHVLLAEDHRDLHMVLRRFLERAGAVVESAFDGGEALARAASASFDIILMDLRMPFMDGLQVARTLRRQGCETPIIALTADAATRRRGEALEAGFDECLSKPFTTDDLIACMRSSARPKARAKSA
jgi:signal transduction histidine kinase/ActR/RegA family two-component response regulator